MSNPPVRIYRPVAAIFVCCAIVFLGGNARADLTPPRGNAVTAGVIAGMVLRQEADSSPLIDAELAWTYFPSDFAGGILTPGVVVDAGVELAPTRGRLTVASKLGILYVLTTEAGIAVRTDANESDIGVSGRLRLNLPMGELLHLSPYVRHAVYQGGARDTEFGIGVKWRFWGDSSKLEGLLNR